MKNSAIAIALVLLLTACGDKPESTKSNQALQPTLPQYKLDFPTLSAAIAGSRLEMGETQNAELSRGAAQFAIWSADRMRWADLQAVPQGKYGLAMKDPETQRGQRLCVQGATVIEIHAKNTSNGHKVFMGGLMNDYSGSVYRFVAVGSTGALVAQNRANFCGVFMGLTSYANSAGGTTHAVQLIGMFDLPENRKP